MVMKLPEGERPYTPSPEELVESARRQKQRDDQDFTESLRLWKDARLKPSQELIAQLKAKAEQAERDRQDRLGEKVRREVATGVLAHPDTIIGQYQVWDRLGMWNTERAMALSGLPLEALSLAAFNPRPQHPSVAKAKIAAELYLAPMSLPFLTLAGPPGVGKTHLAHGIGRALCELGKLVVYRTESQIVNELLGAIEDSKASQADPFSDFCYCDCLIIDDLGVENAQRWTAARMDNIIDTRYVGKRRTIITTNALGAQLPPRIASRLRDTSTGQVVVISAEDYRSKRK